jgi:hypothetical protein
VFLKKYHIFNRILEKSQRSFYWNMICLSLTASDLMPQTPLLSAISAAALIFDIA